MTKRKLKRKSLGYTMCIVGTGGKTPAIFINPVMKRNLEPNRISGKRRFYMSEKKMKEFREFILEQWKNNIEESD